MTASVTRSRYEVLVAFKEKGDAVGGGIEWVLVVQAVTGAVKCWKIRLDFGFKK